MNFDEIFVNLYTKSTRIRRKAWKKSHHIQFNGEKKIIDENGDTPDLRGVDVQSGTTDWVILCEENNV